MNNIVSEGLQRNTPTGEPEPVSEQDEEPTSPLSNQLSEFLENSVEDFLTTINKSSPVANIDTTTRKTSTTTTTTSTTSSTTTSSSSSQSTTTPPNRSICQPQTSSPLPHIKEEEESENTVRSPTEIDSVKLLTSSSSRNLSDEQYSSTPSPHSKHKNRKQHKTSWGSRILPSVGISTASTTSSETLGSLSGSTVIGSSGGSLTSNTNNTTSILSTSVPLSTGLLIQPKMQAEQGSIGDLQKYHGRYLKNRRHTLANVR